MKVVLQDDRTRGLTSHTISLLPPFAGAPAAVEAAIEKRKYFVVRCEYHVEDDWRDAFYWNANGPVPPADVQEALASLIVEPRTACPPEYVAK